jgi:hypothetical protein
MVARAPGQQDLLHEELQLPFQIGAVIGLVPVPVQPAFSTATSSPLSLYRWRRASRQHFAPFPIASFPQMPAVKRTFGRLENAARRREDHLPRPTP